MIVCNTAIISEVIALIKHLIFDYIVYSIYTKKGLTLYKTSVLHDWRFYSWSNLFCDKNDVVLS